MEVVIARAKSIVLDCNNVDKKLRQLVDLTEDEANFHMKQSAFLYQLAVQTVPKSLHCLSMRLAVEYFKSPPPDAEQSMAEKYMNPSLQHFVIFSNNILASSVVINSTVMHTRVGSLHYLMHFTPCPVLLVLFYCWDVLFEKVKQNSVLSSQTNLQKVLLYHVWRSNPTF